MDVVEVAVGAMDTKTGHLEQALHSALQQVNKLRLLLEEQEDRSRRCNLRLKGLPERRGKEDLKEEAKKLFMLILQADKG